MSTQLAQSNYVGDLGDGLRRRWSTKADQEKIGYLMGSVFRDSPDDPLNFVGADEARVFMSEGFPLMGPGDIAIVEDTRKPDCPIVACTAVWRRQWSYGGIPFAIGQPENVVTDPAYRNRGLVRALFEMFHARSAQEGHLVQVITGIPYFYRQFGYEFVLDLGGSRRTPLAAIPDKKPDEVDPYTLRLATLDDLDHLQTLYNQVRHSSLVWNETDAAYWRYHITGWQNPEIVGRDATQIGLVGRLFMIVDHAGQVCGYTALAAKRWGSDFAIFGLRLYPFVNWQTAMPCLLRAFQEQGKQVPLVPPNQAPFSELRFHLGRAHPFYVVLGERLIAHSEPPYAWYVRVPDLPALIRHIAPVLEARLANSLLTGYNGTLKLDFYRAGLRLQFVQGKLTAVEPWQTPAYGEEAQAGCPALVFLQLLFGYRSLDELRAFFPDVWANPDAALLINILLPKQTSVVHSLTYT